MRRPDHRLVTLLFFLAVIVIGAINLDDYGISWDEAIQRRHGRVSIDYAADKLGLDHIPLEPDYDLEDYQWSNYGMLYQITASLLEQRLGLQDNDFAFYRLRHLMNFSLFVLALVCFYRTLRLRWPTQVWYPLLGTAMLLLSPRIYGHAFFNPKDHILLVFYLLATYTLLRYLRSRTTPALLLHIVATALALNTRLPALLILLATVLILLWEQLHRPGNYRRLLIILVYVIGSFLLMIPFFPFLWEDTYNRLVAAFLEMSDFDWASTMLLFGDVLDALHPPAYYIPAWILITTPVVYLAFMLIGIYWALRRSVVALSRFRLWNDYFEQADFVALGLSIGPILVVIALHSTLYNGWRHLHFVYPGLVFLALVGFDRLRRWSPRLVPAVMGVGLLMTGISMVRYHPHEYVYFNFLITGDPILARFDMDYWGTGFREAFVELGKTLSEGEVARVRCQSWPCKDNIYALPPDLQGRIVISDSWEAADYVATQFLYPNERVGIKTGGEYFQHPVVELRPAGQLTIGIYRINLPE